MSHSWAKNIAIDLLLIFVGMHIVVAVGVPFAAAPVQRISTSELGVDLVQLRHALSDAQSG
jgi:hypothetical protein